MYIKFSFPSFLQRALSSVSVASWTISLPDTDTSTPSQPHLLERVRQAITRWIPSPTICRSSAQKPRLLKWRLRAVVSIWGNQESRNPLCWMRERLILNRLRFPSMAKSILLWLAFEISLLKDEGKSENTNRTNF